MMFKLMVGRKAGSGSGSGESVTAGDESDDGEVSYGPSGHSGVLTEDLVSGTGSSGSGCGMVPSPHFVPKLT